MLLPVLLLLPALALPTQAALIEPAAPIAVCVSADSALGRFCGPAVRGDERAGVPGSAARPGTMLAQEAPPEDTPSGGQPGDGIATWQAAVIAVLVAGVLVWLASLVGKRRRR